MHVRALFLFMKCNVKSETQRWQFRFICFTFTMNERIASILRSNKLNVCTFFIKKISQTLQSMCCISFIIFGYTNQIFEHTYFTNCIFLCFVFMKSYFLELSFARMNISKVPSSTPIILGD